jgi:Cu/Ag efflux protein CusF
MAENLAGALANPQRQTASLRSRPMAKSALCILSALVFFLAFSLLAAAPNAAAQGHNRGRGSMPGMDHSGTHGADSQEAAPPAAGRGAPAPSPGASVSGLFEGRGVVEEVDSANNKIRVRHEPRPAVGWEGMTMSFGVEDPSLLEGVKAGDSVRFDLEFTPRTDGGPPDFAIADLEVQ